MKYLCKPNRLGRNRNWRFAVRKIAARMGLRTNIASVAATTFRPMMMANTADQP